MIPGLYKCFEHWCNQTVWVYSDPHFNDKEQMESYSWISAEEQIKRINAKVGRKDTLIILGDVGDIECVKQLRGYKVLVAGNHDAGLSNYEEVFDEVYGGPLMIGEKLILSHEPIPNITWAMNIHGHVHNKNYKNDKYHFNCCSNTIDFTPINFNQWMKQGHLSHILSIHRNTIDKATERKNKRVKKENKYGK